MKKQDWLNQFQAVNGRPATEAEVAQAIATGEFQDEWVGQPAPAAPNFVAAPVAPDQVTPNFVGAPASPDEVASQLGTIPVWPEAEEPSVAPAPEAPVAPAPGFTPAPEEAVGQAPGFTPAPEAPVGQAPGFTPAPEAPVGQAPTQAAPQFGSASVNTVGQQFWTPVQGGNFQQAPQQQPQPGFGQVTPGQGFEQVGYQGHAPAGQPYYSQSVQPNAFNQTIGGFWSWFVSALIRPTAKQPVNILNGLLHYALTALLLTISVFLVANTVTFGEVGISSFFLIMIAVYLTLYAFQFGGFFVRRVVLQDQEFGYKQSFDLFARLSIYALPGSLLVLLMTLIRFYDGFSFIIFLLIALFGAGTSYITYEGLNKTKLKMDKFFLLLASFTVYLAILILVIIIDRYLLSQISIFYLPI
ncbi:DUF6574 domain-containing protein [Streptococcus rubneri]|uniref:DUF6574 domain-containing protein n=1 Tax=Streptococcus rubneri TaxID=1234680 RepID=UPI0039C297BA